MLIASTFPIGQLVATKNALAHLTMSDIQTALSRYGRRDWGDLCKADREENDLAVDGDGRILAVYVAENGTRFWVITELDRSATTILLPEDY
jgi:hypothetical protein